MRFDWDDNKAKSNIKNHDDITFDDAIKVFNDIWAIDDYDIEHSDIEEQRFAIVGLAAEVLLYVIFTIRKDDDGNEVIRIISVRKAAGKEKKGYEEARNRYDI